MHIALIKNGVIDNIILGDLDFAKKLPGYDSAIALSSRPENPSIGWIWNETTQAFEAPVPVVIPAHVPTPKPESERLKNVNVADLLTMAQLRPVLADVIALLTSK